MKLAEALVLRADMQKRLEQVKSRLLRNARVQEGDKPAEDPDALLAEYDAITRDLVQLIRRINASNSAATVAGRSMTEALALRDILKHRASTYRELADAASVTQYAMTRTEIRFRATVSVPQVQKVADGIARELRELDARIQEANWQIELAD